MIDQIDDGSFGADLPSITSESQEIVCEIASAERWRREAVLRGE